MTEQTPDNLPVPSPGDADLAPLVVDVASNIVSNSKVHLNLHQDIVVTTRDKAELALRRSLPKYFEWSRSLASGGIFLACLLAQVTTDFKSKLGVSAGGWEALFMVATIGGLVWLATDVWRAVHGLKIEEIVDAILQGAQTPDDFLDSDT